MPYELIPYISYVDVRDVVDVSVVKTASIFKIEMCKSGEFLCICRKLYLKKQRVGESGISAYTETHPHSVTAHEVN
jgi:hypothetical protein